MEAGWRGEESESNENEDAVGKVMMRGREWKKG